MQIARQFKQNISI